MADVGAIKQAIIAETPQEMQGTLSAYTMVYATGFNGLKVFRRVRIGLEFGVTPDNAKVMMKNLRDANSGEYGQVSANIAGRLVIEV